MRGEAHPRTSHSRHMPGATIRIAGRGRRDAHTITVDLVRCRDSSRSWRPRWHKGSLPNSKATLMAVLLTRLCGSGSTARNTRSTSEIRMPASSVGRSRPRSTMPARPDEDSAVGRYVPHRAVSAAATSGRGRKARASRSASAAASRRALSSSTKPPRQERDASANRRRPRADSRTADPV